MNMNKHLGFLSTGLITQVKFSDIGNHCSIFSEGFHWSGFVRPNRLVNKAK